MERLGRGALRWRFCVGSPAESPTVSQAKIRQAIALLPFSLYLPKRLFSGNRMSSKRVIRMSVATVAIASVLGAATHVTLAAAPGGGGTASGAPGASSAPGASTPGTNPGNNATNPGNVPNPGNGTNPGMSGAGSSGGNSSSGGYASSSGGYGSSSGGYSSSSGGRRSSSSSSGSSGSSSGYH